MILIDSKSGRTNEKAVFTGTDSITNSNPAQWDDRLWYDRGQTQIRLL